MLKLKLVSVGTLAGIIVPKEMLAHLRVGRGDRLFVTETPSGYLLTRYDPAVEQQLELGREFMKTYRETFRDLTQ